MGELVDFGPEPDTDGQPSQPIRFGSAEMEADGAGHREQFSRFCVWVAEVGNGYSEDVPRVGASSL
jgi:hypothetical protein